VKLKRLTIKDFRNHENTDIKIPHALIITGPEGSGKSTIRYALEVALRGNASFPDSRPLVRRGQKEARVKAEFAMGESTRIIEKIIPVDPSKPQRTNLMNHQALLDFVGVDKDVAQVLCSTHRFENMTKDERVRMFSKLVLGQITLKTIKDEVIAGIREEHKEATKALLNADDMDAGGNDALAIYKQLGAAVRTKRSKLDVSLELQQEARDKLTVNLEEAKKEHKEPTNNTDEIAQWWEDNANLNVIKPDLEGKKENLIEIKKRIETITNSITSKEEFDKKKEPHTKAITEAHMRQEALNSDELDKEWTRLFSLVESLKKADPSKVPCPHFGGCQLSETKLSALISDNLEKTQEELKKANAASEIALEAYDTFQGKCDIATEALLEIKKEEEASQALEKTLALLKSSQERTEKTIESIEASVTSLEEAVKGKDFSSIQQVSETTSHASIEKQITDADRVINKGSKELTLWEMLQKELRPTAAWRRMVMSRMKPLANEIKVWGKHLANTDDITLSPDEVDLVVHDLPFDYLSESERYKICVAVQQAISKVSKAGIVIIDDIRRVIDISPITSMAKEIAKDTECTIIVISPEDLDIEGFEKINIKEGKVGNGTDINTKSNAEGEN